MVNGYTKAEIKGLPTLEKGHCCDLKVEDHGAGERVWLCRTDGTVSIERRDRDGHWTTVQGH